MDLQLTAGNGCNTPPPDAFAIRFAPLPQVLTVSLGKEPVWVAHVELVADEVLTPDAVEIAVVNRCPSDGPPVVTSLGSVARP